MQEGREICFNFYLNADKSVNLASQVLLEVFFIVHFFCWKLQLDLLLEILTYRSFLIIYKL